MRNKRNSKLGFLGSIQLCGSGNEKQGGHASSSPLRVWGCVRRQPSLERALGQHAVMNIQILVKLRRAVNPQREVEVFGDVWSENQRVQGRVSGVGKESRHKSQGTDSGIWKDGED